eukprot:3145085-Rhodomonas_salina.5
MPCPVSAYEAATPCPVAAYETATPCPVAAYEAAMSCPEALRHLLPLSSCEGVPASYGMPGTDTPNVPAWY